jgi:hypothetical protein
MGTARAPVAGSGLSCPACKAMVSGWYDIGSNLLDFYYSLLELYGKGDLFPGTGYIAGAWVDISWNSQVLR